MFFIVRFSGYCGWLGFCFLGLRVGLCEELWELLIFEF